MPFGCALEPEGSARFRLWAPSSATAMLELTLPDADEPTRHTMRSLHGWHEIDIADDRERQSLAVPDPASRSNPCGVPG
jgi:1,4-alpha-glucan branching enzyme